MTAAEIKRRNETLNRILAQPILPKRKKLVPLAERFDQMVREAEKGK